MGWRYRKPQPKNNEIPRRSEKGFSVGMTEEKEFCEMTVMESDWSKNTYENFKKINVELGDWKTSRYIWKLNTKQPKA